MIPRIPICIGALLLPGCLSLPNFSESVRVWKLVRTASEEHCFGRSELIERLRKKGDLPGLYAICNSDVNVSHQAAQAIVEMLSSDAAVAFCRELPIGSPKWKSAFWALRFHPREKVIDFFIDVVKSDNDWHRAYCYSVCPAEWPDLIAFAESDVDNETPYIYVNVFPPDNTVGQEARAYIQRANQCRLRPAESIKIR